MRDVKASRIQCDEIWSFAYAKAKNVPVGGRDSGYAIDLMDDLAKRLTNRVQLTTDGHKAYLEAVEGAVRRRPKPEPGAQVQPVNLYRRAIPITARKS